MLNLNQLMATSRVINNWKMFFRNSRANLKAFDREMLGHGCESMNGVELNWN